MSASLSQHQIAPALVLRGRGAWQSALSTIGSLVQRPLWLGRRFAASPLGCRHAADLEGAGLSLLRANLQHDCCDDDVERIAIEVTSAGCDGVIAFGGGKVLDAGKLLADRLDLPCITVPTSAATCAGWTALANVYSPEGAFCYDVPLRRCPELLVFDHDLVAQAPPRTLASGIADAVAKWYEASVSSGASSDGLIQQAVQMARVLRDQLLLDGQAAMAAPGDPCVCFI